MSVAVYECHWTEKSKPFKQSMCFVIQRAQKRLILQGGRFFVMNLELFLGVNYFLIEFKSSNKLTVFFVQGMSLDICSKG